jgi:spore maturation protein CgeB
MRIVFFYHSLISDWNHSNAHFLRGIAVELQRRGHEVRIFEPADGWSLLNLIEEYGERPVAEFAERFPSLQSSFYSLPAFDLDQALDGADLVMVHEWNDHELVQQIGLHRSRSRYCLLFHDTHHRAVSDPESIGRYALEHFDGVLAFGEVIRDIYRRRGWARRAWTWHEAADTTVFRPVAADSIEGDLVWIGNWGAEERTAELSDYFIRPVRTLGLRANVYGVRYPDEAKQRLEDAGISYRGWVPNYRVPETLCAHRATVHIPRQPYVDALPGIPTIRVFEALACGVPLVSARWDDVERLFTPGEDFLMANNPKEMKTHLKDVIFDRELAQQISQHGLNSVLARHTCAHRVDELLEIVREITDVAEATSVA